MKNELLNIKLSNKGTIKSTELVDIINQFRTEIYAKSALSGTTQLLQPDDMFNYRMHEKFVESAKDVSNITGEILNKWYFVTSSIGYSNFPPEVSWGFVKYIAIENIRICIFICGENHAISVNTYTVETQQWGGWIQS